MVLALSSLVAPAVVIMTTSGATCGMGVSVFSNVNWRVCQFTKESHSHDPPGRDPYWPTCSQVCPAPSKGWIHLAEAVWWWVGICGSTELSCWWSRSPCMKRRNSHDQTDGTPCRDAKWWGSNSSSRTSNASRWWLKDSTWLCPQFCEEGCASGVDSAASACPAGPNDVNAIDIRPQSLSPAPLMQQVDDSHEFFWAYNPFLFRSHYLVALPDDIIHSEPGWEAEHDNSTEPDGKISYCSTESNESLTYCIYCIIKAVCVSWNIKRQKLLSFCCMIWNFLFAALCIWRWICRKTYTKWTLTLWSRRWYPRLTQELPISSALYTLKLRLSHQTQALLSTSTIWH